MGRTVCRREPSGMYPLLELDRDQVTLNPRTLRDKAGPGWWKQTTTASDLQLDLNTIAQERKAIFETLQSDSDN
ncbi:hypothetical protein NDU88_004650 [Pleurodeles waltl]|uniref:Uncharacterized protein n=1 Tax=Pleurodeles waltl TaxID=8319 RepID=A0AAV7LIX0_PLEWA|nr:hypothetical protein NDU88_004650 [Pleurodeles waltl]